MQTIKAYVDLMRLHFFFVWPTLFSAGLFLAFQHYAGFSWFLVLKAVLIGFIGFEAGLILNDIVDSSIDRKEVEADKLTKYWRVFGRRPISEGMISKQNAVVLFFVLVALTTALIFTLPLPNAFYVVGIMVFCYSLEVFYQIRKRSQRFPLAQLLGRIDFTLFPVAGYLCLGSFDLPVLLFAVFFYPLAQAHLGVNDLIDTANDQAKDMQTIPVMYGTKNAVYWILGFSIAHAAAAIAFLSVLGWVALAGFTIGLTLIAAGNYLILKTKNAAIALKALPLFHLALLSYSISIILQYFL
ncbi:MAG: UbiA family prenyltransferase [Candidatus Bathyarchaeota archaeon]|nr:UbiA family prenyltransferase [Candidatus Bathyarchaeota archaeon]